MTPQAHRPGDRQISLREAAVLFATALGIVVGVWLFVVVYVVAFS